MAQNGKMAGEEEQRLVSGPGECLELKVGHLSLEAVYSLRYFVCT